MITEDLASQIEIRDLTARFTDAVNRRAPKELAALFTEDGEWHVPGVPEATGQVAISELLGGLLANFQQLVQLTHSGHVDVTGAVASASWYVSENAEDADGRTFAFIGVYRDRLVRTGDGWRFASRSFGFLRHGRADGSARWYPHPDVVTE